MRVLILVFTLLISHLATAQDCNAKARKVNGLDIYIYSEPTREYEEVFEGSGFWNWNEAFGVRVTIENIVETMVRNVKKKNDKAKKKNEPTADGIIIYNNDKASAIRYTDNEKAEVKN